MNNSVKLIDPLFHSEYKIYIYLLIIIIIFVLGNAFRIFLTCYNIGLLWIAATICQSQQIFEQNSRDKWLLFHDSDAANFYSKY